jgi:hypothetical protein
MAVNAIGQSHLSQPEQAASQTATAQKALNAAPKTNTANATAHAAGHNEAHGTTAAVAAENNAGREQGNRQNAETETRGTLVNVFA